MMSDPLKETSCRDGSAEEEKRALQAAEDARDAGTKCEIEEFEEEIEHAHLPVAPDGGWGWVIVVASFFNNFIVDGVCYTFAIFYDELIVTFESSKSETALVGSLVAGVYLIVGPIVGALANKFGCRIVTIVGSIIASIAFFISRFSNSIVMMLLSYGLMGGIGFGLMYLPSIVMVGHYFDKKRALATGISVCGSSIGTFVFAPLGSYLVEEYTWKGANTIFAGIILHGILFGAVFRPLIVKRCVFPRSKIIESTAAEKRRQRTLSTGSTDGAILMDDNSLVVPAQNNNLNGHCVPLEPQADALRSSKTNVAALSGSRTGHARSNLSLQGHKPNGGFGSNLRVRTVSGANAENGVEGGLTIQAAKPFNRSDVLYQGSVQKLAGHTGIQSYVASVTRIPSDEEVVEEKGFFAGLESFSRIMFEMFDFSLFKSPTFACVYLSGVFVFLGLYTPFVYVTQKAEGLGSTKDQASLILSVIGITNTVSRVTSGLIADLPFVDAVVVHNVAAIMMGVTTGLVSVLNSYALLMVYAAVFGIFMASFIALRSIVIVELMGIKKLNNAFGLLTLFQGIAVLVGSPMTGAIIESTGGSYVVAFIVAGALMSLGGILCLPVRRIARWEHEQAARNHYTVTPSTQPV